VATDASTAGGHSPESHGRGSLFAEHGLDATKMDDVAAATGVPKATLYYYFEGKEDILRFLFLRDPSRGGAGYRRGRRGPRAMLRSDSPAAIEAHLEVFERFPMESRALQFDLGRGRPNAGNRGTSQCKPSLSLCTVCCWKEQLTAASAILRTPGWWPPPFWAPSPRRG